MNRETAIDWIDRALQQETGRHLNDLQNLILDRVWDGKKYIDIADEFYCTEGHVKDVAAQLWQLLSQVLGEKVTKTNLKSVLQRHLAAAGVSLSSTISPVVMSDRLLGREAAIARLDELIQGGECAIVIQGEGGVGKTTLAQQYLKAAGCELVLELLMAKETQQIISPEIVVEEWLRRDFGEEAGREFGVSLLRLKRQVSSRRVGILIDNLEPALDRQGMIISPHRGYVELLRILTDRDTRAITLITSRDRVCEPDINVTHYRLSGLDLKTWCIYFDRRQISSDIEILTKLHFAYGGNAKAMEIIAGNIISDFDSDLVSYGQEYQDRPLGEIQLKHLIANQFDRLERLDSEAYNLLCRLGCYRYQDIPRLNQESLSCLLWDIPADRSLEIINSLKHRSLVEFYRGKYWMHPAVRAEALARLRMDREIWKRTHQTIAASWTNSVQKITDLDAAITALEAYYHYVEIGDFYQAAQVLLQPRDNQWGQFLPLGSTLYRMGAIQPIFNAIDSIIKHLSGVGLESIGSSERLNCSIAELYNILGDIHWIRGDVRAAILAQEQTMKLAIEELNHLADRRILNDNLASHHRYYLKMLEVDAILSLGLYHIDLWELEIAQAHFQTVIAIASNTNHDRWAQKAQICLALVTSYLGDIPSTQSLLNQIFQSPLLAKLTGSSAYFLQILGQTYSNVGEWQRAREIYHQTLTFCQSGNYLQIQGKTLTGLAEIDRARGEFRTAKDRHLQAINILDQIGAKCDLAEAYLQAAITWEKAGEASQSQLYRNQAEQLFTEISAPKQIAKLPHQSGILPLISEHSKSVNG